MNAKLTIRNITIIWLTMVASLVMTPLLPVKMYAACAALPTDKGTATSTVNIPSTTSYRLWARILAPDSTNNSFMMQVDNTYCSITVGNSSSIPANQLTWVDYQNGNTSSTIDMNLSAGNHTVTIAGTENGVGVDKLLFLSDKTCIPIGDGSNCTSSSSVSPSPTPPSSSGGGVIVGTPPATSTNSAPTPVSGVVTLAPPADVPSGSTISYSVDGQKINGNTLDTSKLSPGEHTVTTTVVKPDGTTETLTKKIMVKNPVTKLVFAALGIVTILAGAGYTLAYLRRRRALNMHFYNSTAHSPVQTARTMNNPTVIQPQQSSSDTIHPDEH